MSDRNSDASFIVGFTIGATVGLAIGFLYAPKPGRETQRNCYQSRKKGGRKTETKESGRISYQASRTIGAGLICPACLSYQVRTVSYRHNDKHTDQTLAPGSFGTRYHHWTMGPLPDKVGRAPLRFRDSAGLSFNASGLLVGEKVAPPGKLARF
jgi:hypothetical protein